jgi:hypothetical protein
VSCVRLTGTRNTEEKHEKHDREKLEVLRKLTNSRGDQGKRGEACRAGTGCWVELGEDVERGDEEAILDWIAVAFLSDSMVERYSRRAEDPRVQQTFRRLTDCH